MAEANQDMMGLDTAYFGEPYVFVASESFAAENPEFAYFGQPLMASPATVPDGPPAQEIPVGEEKSISMAIGAIATLNASTQRLRTEGFAVNTITDVIASLNKEKQFGLILDGHHTNMAAAFNRLRGQGIDLHEEAKVQTEAGVTRSVAFNPTTGTAMVMSLPRKRNHGSLAVHGEASVSEMFVARVRSSSYDIDVHCDTDANFSRAMSVIADIGSVIEVIDEINRERGAELSLEEKAMLDFNMIAVQLEFQKWAVIVYDKKVVVSRDGVYRVLTTKTRHKL